MRKFEREMARRLKRLGFSYGGITEGDHLKFVHNDPSVRPVVVSSTPRVPDRQYLNAERDARRRLNEGGTKVATPAYSPVLVGRATNGQRISAGDARQLILNALASATRPMTPTELYETCRDSRSWGPTPSPHSHTPMLVYRVLSGLRQKNIVTEAGDYRAENGRLQKTFVLNTQPTISATPTKPRPKRLSSVPEDQPDIDVALGLLRDVIKAELVGDTVSKEDHEAVVRERDELRDKLAQIRRQLG